VVLFEQVILPKPQTQVAVGDLRGVAGRGCRVWRFRVQGLKVRKV